MKDIRSIRFSIIIPAYNAKKTLHRIIDDICGQTYPAYDVIIIDDCSTDGTGIIADQIVKEKNQLWSVVHQKKNRGVSVARNTGMDRARGDWILFFDADDRIEPDLLERAARSISETKAEGKKYGLPDASPDVVIYSISEDFLNADGKLIYSKRHMVDDQVVFGNVQANNGGENKALAALTQCLEKETIYGYPWNKAYRLEALRESGARFPDISFGEDILFNIQFFDAVRIAAAIKKPLYHYMNQESDRLTGKYLPDYFDLQKRRYTEFLRQQARWLCSGGEDLQELKQSALGRSALGLISGRYFRSFSSWISRELSHGTRHSEIENKAKREFEQGELYALLRPFLPDLGMSGRFLYEPLQRENARQAIRHAGVLNRIRKHFPGLYDRLKQNR